MRAITQELKRHGHDSMNQDSGVHCHCGSDSRFSQHGGDDPPWSSVDEHRAQQVLLALRDHLRAVEAADR